ncbi:MAG: diguanylate cyclase [Halofilum sp. (in: g-proteobacteria)]
MATIRAQIVLLVVLASLLLSVLAVWVATAAVEDYLTDRIEARFPTTLAVKARDVRAWYDRISADLRGIAQAPAMRRSVPHLVDGSDGEARRLLRSHLLDMLGRYPRFGALVVAGPDGRALSGVGHGFDIAVGWPAPSRPHAGEPPSYGVIERDGRRRHLLSMPVPTAEGVFLRAILDLRRLDRLLATGITHEPVDIYVVDGAGRYVAGTLSAVGGHDWYRGPGSTNPDPIAVYENDLGVEVIGAARPVGRFGWEVVIEQARATATAPVRALITRVFWVAVALALLLVAGAVILALSIVRPLEALARAADRAADGRSEIELPDPRGARELRRLTAAFNQMTVRLSANRRELERRADELQHLSVTDGLTGLYNHRYFKEQLPLEAKRAERASQRLALILVDIDDFKAINDTFGHAIGDGVLRVVARAVNDEVRATDLVARYGGEEFGVITQQKSEEGAVVLAEKIRRAVAAIEYELPQGRKGPASDATVLRLTVSVGVGIHRPGLDTEAVFDAADSALYTAKLSGKNRVELNYPGGARRAP